VKKSAGILLLLCSATMACNWNDPIPGQTRGGAFRTVGPRLSNTGWKACCRKAEIRPACDERLDALEQLVTADRNCIDKALIAVQKHSRDDLPAAYYIRAQRKGDPVDYLRALNAALEGSSSAARFNRALAQEKLGLVQEAIRSWDDVVKGGEKGWSEEARKHRQRLLDLRDPEWRIDKLEEALRNRDRASLTKIVRAFPPNAISAFERSDLLDVETSRFFAEALNSPYARSIVDAVEHPKDRPALEQGMRALRQARTLTLQGKPEAAGKYEEAARLLERAGNPLYVSIGYQIVADRFRNGADAVAFLDHLIPEAEKYAYPGLSDILTLRAIALGYQNRYFQALEAYKQAITSAKRDPTAIIGVLTRRSGNYARIGSLELAFLDSFQALGLLSNVASVNARNNTYGAAADAARQLGYPKIALQYQNAAVDTTRKGVLDARADWLRAAKINLLVALRARADLYLELERDSDAQADLQQASDLAEAVDEPEMRSLLEMRIKEVIGQASLKTNPGAAVTAFSEAIALAAGEDSTYRAILLYKRAAARREAKDPNADDDIGIALKILREEAGNLLDQRKRGAYESLWTPYFSRFQAMHRDMVEGRISDKDQEGAFVYAEQARGFEPMHLLLQSRFAVPGFRTIESKEDLREHLASLPDDTVILQYLVLDDHTYAWVLTRDHIELPLRLGVGRKKIEEWVSNVNDGVSSGQRLSILDAMVPPYEELFRKPLASATARSQKRIVIVPDGPMHGLPFAALHNRKDGYVIARSSIAVAGSTSLYLYALQRDRQFRPAQRPPVLVVGNPTLNLPYAGAEAAEIGNEYPNSTVLLGGHATVQNVLTSARDAAIIHFAGHGEANPQSPSLSMLRLAPDDHDPGVLTAERLMTELSELKRTRLVVLAACSTAGGVAVGPEGMAPLVRPIIAANVPAVVGTLWEVNDATVKKLLVSLHCHYRNGDDVAVALQHAQLEMLRNENARTWAAFQVVGYAGSPYAPHAAMEKPHSEHVCTQNSLHRPDGLHSQ
jgi:CHAT domain-containing protein